MGLQNLVIGYIDRWLSDKPERKLTTLSRITGIEYHALRRIYKSDSQVDIGNILPLCDSVCDYDETLEIVEKYFPRLEKFFAVSKNQKLTPPLAKLLRQEMFQLPFLMAASESGTTKKQVEKVLGDVGLTALNELIGLEFLSVSNDGTVFLDSKKMVVVVNNELSKSIMKTLLQSVDTDRITLENEGVIRFAFEGFKEEVTKELNTDIINLYDKVVGYMNDPSKHGDAKWYCGLFASTLRNSEGQS